MADLGVDPDRTVTGSWGTGEDTELVHLPSDPPTFGDQHWPWAVPSALLITARLGSLATSERCVPWITEHASLNYAFWFAARRSAGGDTVQLMFGLKDPVDPLAGHEDGPSVPWRGAGHLYAWAIRVTGGHPFGTGVVYASGNCDVATKAFDGSGNTSGIVGATWGQPGLVGTAPADLRVEHAASWWTAPPNADAPDGAQMTARIKTFTCRHMAVGRTEMVT